MQGTYGFKTFKETKGGRRVLYCLVFFSRVSELRKIELYDIITLVS